MSTTLSSNGLPASTFGEPMTASRSAGLGLGTRILMFPIRLFSSIWLGITLLTLLFVYSSIGSAGVPIKINIFDPSAWVALRQWRAFELTEFEWFHWWPFNLLIALICLNIIVATLRRIPFNAVNLGVWMIHTGILTLAAGSVWYFTTKVEGEAPIARRQIVIQAPGIEPTTMTVIPGNRIIVGRGNDQYALTIGSIDPEWEIRSGQDEGKKTYSVNVEVRSAGGTFIRQLLAGYPQYTEDIIRSSDPGAAQPMTRAIKAIGKPLVDEALQLSLEYDPQPYFYLADSRAVYLRELNPDGTPRTDWIQRPIRGRDLPRYNDYIASEDDVWTAAGQEEIKPDPLRVEVPPVDPLDPLPNTALRISRYLRYAILEPRHRAVPDGPLNPLINVRVSSPQGQSEQYELAAFDREHNTASAGKIAFVWIEGREELDALKQIIEPMLHIVIPAGTGGAGGASANVTIDRPIRQVSARNPDLPFEPIEGTEYSYRVQGVQDDLNISNRRLSVAIVEIKSPQKMFTRWVFDNPRFNRDLAMTADSGSTPAGGGGVTQHEAEIPLDPGIETTYKPGRLPPAPILLVAGPSDHDLTAVISLTAQQNVHENLNRGDVIPIAEGVTLSVQNYAARTVEETRPAIVPRQQRDRDVRELYSLIRVDVPAESGTASQWLPYNFYAFRGPDEVLRRFPYRPVVIAMPDGRKIEMMFSRQRLPLPAPVALDEFKVASHIGGFTGQTSTVMDWTSMIRFRDGDVWTAPAQVSVNKPSEFQGFWLFQAQWDPPESPRFQGDPGSRGLNYTVLGVGNRNGVHVQLAGCCIAVLGMCYAFYIKPMVKRRRQQMVYAQVALARAQPHVFTRESVDAVLVEEES